MAATKSDDAEVARRAGELAEKFRWGIYPNTTPKVLALISRYQGADENGRFRMGTNRAADGAYVGKHKVVIARSEVSVDRPTPRVLPEKYESFETSNLTATVEARGDNEIALKVERLKKK